jgi:type II secretory pathway component PulJ
MILAIIGFMLVGMYVSLALVSTVLVSAARFYRTIYRHRHHQSRR